MCKTLTGSAAGHLRHWAGAAALLGAMITPIAVQAQAQAQEVAQILPAVPLRAGMHNIRAEVAQSPAQRQIGLMHRKSMPANDGMLFVFEAPSPQCFWMKNTLLPLSIAFLADDGTIVNVADMKPMDETSHCSAKPVRYALEMNQGWFSKRGLKAGSRIEGEGFQH